MASTFFVYLTMAAYLISPIQSCPTNCTCMQDVVMVVICSGQGFTAIPEGLPKNTEMLNLRYNSITVLDLRKLYDLESLERIDLSSNKIKTFHGSFEVLKNLDIVDLSYNKIESIPWKTFGNILEQLNTLRLDGNPFNCDCDQWKSDLCDCSGDIFTCTCNIQWLKDKVSEYPTLGWGVTCQEPAALSGKSVEDVNFVTYWCKTKNHRIVGGIGGGLALLILLVGTAILVCKRHRRSKRKGYVEIHEVLPEQWSTPAVGRRDDSSSTEVAGENAGNAGMREPDLVVNRETDPREGREVIVRDPTVYEQAAAAEFPSASGPGQTQAEVYGEDGNIDNQTVSQRLPVEIARKIVTEQQLNTLAKKMGSEWEGLAIDMGLKQAEVEQCRDNHPGKTDRRIFDMLRKWKAKQKAKATVGNIVKALEAYDVDEDKFDFFLKCSDVTSQELGGTPDNTENSEDFVPDIPEESLNFFRLVSSLLGINFIPLRNEGAEKKRVKKISEWETTFSSEQTGTISDKADDMINFRKRAVCKIDWPVDGHGTGFLIGKREILTNWHVLKLMLEAYKTNPDNQSYTATFHVFEHEHIFHFTSTSPLSHDETLDYAILELDSEPDSALVPSLGPFISSITDSTRFVVVIGHPSGGSKQLQYCPVAEIADKFAIHVKFGNLQAPAPNPDLVSYQTHGMYWGSSGSPGFNSDGNVILLHTKGFFPYYNSPSVIEQGIKLTSIVEHSKSKLTSEKFDELFPTFSSSSQGDILFGGIETMDVQEGE